MKKAYSCLFDSEKAVAAVSWNLVCPLNVGSGRFKQRYMINQYEVAACLQDELPEVSDEIPQLAALDIHSTIQGLTDYARSRASSNDFSEVRKCMLFAEKMYGKGNKYVRDVIENIFVFSFSSMLLCERKQKMKLLALIPLSLYSLYVQQILRSHV
jgi:hypothetical protein